MLQFIFGKACSGKTTAIFEKIKTLSFEGEESILIVPEQFTFETEKGILNKIGDSAALNTTVLSFNRLYDEVLRNVGGIAGTVLSDAEKIIFMHRALNTAKDNLKLWKKYVNSVNFAKTMLDTIGEFKINAVTYEDIKKAANNSESETLKYKLLDIAKIYEEYDLFLKEKYIDPADKLLKLYNTLLNFKYFENKNVFIDSFKDFTGAQFKIIECIFAQAKNVYITFTYNPKNDREFGIFTNVKSNIQKLTRLAKARSKIIAEPIILNKHFYKTEDLALVEKIMSGEAVETTQVSNVHITKTPSVYDEADFVSFKIRNLVRNEGYRYKDFVVICRDAETYKEAFSAACQKNDINLFYDNRLPLSNFPLCVAADAVIGASNLSTDNILRFHKTGLGTLDFEEIITLENYLYIWNIKGDMWLKTWNMNPKGFVTDEISEKEEEQLRYLNCLRERAIEPILKFRAQFKDNAMQMATALFNLFVDCDFSAKLKVLNDRFKFDNILFSENLLEQSYESYIGILDSLVNCFGQKSISKSEFYEALTLAVSLSTVGTIPQLLDQVTFGSADRIRPQGAKIAFILGANQGVFPKNITNNGIFSLFERSQLIKLDINVSDNSVYSAIDEEFLAYSNICCPTNALYISFAEQSLDGTVLEPSAFVNTLSKGLNIKIKDIKEADNNYFYSPETEKAAISSFCRLFTHEKNTAFNLKNALSEETKTKISNIENIFSDAKKEISPKTAQKLYGTNIAMSATRFDTVNHCKFSYFCRYGLNIKKLQSAEFDVMQKGTIVHYVLEQFINENGQNLEQLSDKDTDLLTEKYLNQYLDSVSGFRSVEDEKSKFLVMLILRSLKDVVKHIRNELIQSEFKPYKCEVKIGTDSDSINIKFPFSKGKIQLYGSIDRMDKYNGYIRIIDYKTGSKKFDLADILFGLNLQMLIYLYAVTRGSGLEDEAAAGILYQPSSRDIKDEGLAMNGLLQNDTELLMSMESTLEGKYIPKVQINKDGTVSRRSRSFIEKERFTDIFDLIERQMAKTGDSILSGDIEVKALDGRNSEACKYCDFAAVCNFDKTFSLKVPDYTNEEIFEKMKEGKF